MSFLAVAPFPGKTFSVVRVSCNRIIYAALRFLNNTFYYRKVVLRQSFIYKLFREKLQGLRGFGSNDNAGGILVQTMDYTRPKKIICKIGLQLGHMPKQSLTRVPSVVSCSWMNHHSLGLIYDKAVLVLINDI